VRRTPCDVRPTASTTLGQTQRSPGDDPQLTRPDANRGRDPGALPLQTLRLVIPEGDFGLPWSSMRFRGLAARALIGDGSRVQGQACSATQSRATAAVHDWLRLPRGSAVNGS